MKTYPLNDASMTLLAEIVTIVHEPMQQESWESLAQVKTPSNEEEQILLKAITSKLLYYKTQRVNEATIWARAIYPLLVLAERDSIRAWAGIPLGSTFGDIELRGELDGALAASVDEEVSTPYLVVVEAKRGVAGRDPMAQLLASLLCAGKRNEEEGAGGKELFGCYTIADVWTFFRATFEWSQPRPVMRVLSSREYTEKTEAPTILAILKAIVGRAV